MTVVDAALEAIEHAGGLRAVQRFLGDRKLRSGVSWDDVGGNLHQHVESGDLTEEDLRGLVVDLHSRANKLVSLYNLSKEVHTIVLAMAESSLDADIESLGFPWLLDREALAELDEKPRPVFTRRTEGGYELFFTSVRLGMVSSPIPIEAIEVAQRPDYVNARMTVEREDRRQAFDVVFVPSTSRLIQVRVDTGKMAAKDRELVRTQLEESIAVPTGLAATVVHPANLFRAVRSIYDDGSEGRVTNLHFNYADGSMTHRKKRTADGQKDVREDEFHKGGAEKVDKKNMQMYYLSVELEAPAKELITVTLPGGQTHLKGQQLLAFHVDTFGSEAALDYAAKTIFKHASKAS